MIDSFDIDVSWLLDNRTSPDEEATIYSYGERIFVGVTWSLISTLGTIGNSLVIISVLLSRKLQTPPNVFVTNLAIADLLTCLFLLGKVVGMVGQDGWPLPEVVWLCAVSAFMLFMCIAVSLFNLAAISFNRFILITQPYEIYQNFFSWYKVGLMVFSTWSIPFGMLLVLFLNDYVDFGYDKKYADCSNMDETFEYTMMFGFLVYLVPLTIIITSYASVFKHIKRHFKKMKVNELNSISHISGLMPRLNNRDISHQGIPPTSSNDMSVLQSSSVQGLVQSEREPSLLAPPGASRRLDKITRRDIKITKNLFIVVIIFFLCFTPYFIIQFIPSLYKLNVYAGIFVIANSAINPIVYARRHPHFKIILTSIVKCQFYRIPEPTDILKRFTSRRRIHPIMWSFHLNQGIVKPWTMYC